MQLSDPYYYLKQNGKITGPFPASRLAAMKREGRLTAGTQLSTDKQEWSAITAVSWLADPVELVPERPAAQPVLPEQCDRQEVRLRLLPSVPPLPEPAAYDEETGDEDGPPDDPASIPRLIGDTLMLCWNTTDKLLPLRRSADLRPVTTAVAAAAAASLLLSVAAGMTLYAVSGRGVLTGFTLGLAVPLCSWLLLFAEIWSFRVVFSPDCRGGNIVDDLLLATALLWIFTIADLSTGMTWRLMVQPPAPWLRPAAILFNLFVWSFTVCNAAAAVRIGLTRFSGLRPRNAVWLTALTLWNNPLLLYFAYHLQTQS